MGITDYLGGRGEAIAFARLTKICRTDADMPYFWPHFLDSTSGTSLRPARIFWLRKSKTILATDETRIEHG